MGDTKRCVKCGGAEFYGMKSHGQCKKCHRAKMVIAKASRRKTNPESVAMVDLKYLLKHKFNITVAEYQEMYDSQHGRCAICEDAIRRTPVLGGGPGRNAGINGRAHVDHDHDTKEVRGLLCTRCNSGLGMFRDNPRWMEKAARYIRVKPFALFSLEAA